MKTGIALIGKGTQDLLQTTVKFPEAFPSAPIVLATTLQGTTYTPGSIQDTFAVTVTSVTNTAFTVNIYRVDTLKRPTPGWDQNLQLAWLAN